MREDLIERLRVIAQWLDQRAHFESEPETKASHSEDADTCREAAAALEAAREDAWLPIETAPKDGTRIMLGNEHGAWAANWRPVYQSGYRPDNPWASSMLNHDHIARQHRHKHATHWRPLPTPPAIDQARGEENGNV